MRTGCKCLRSRGRGHEGADGHAAAEPLGQRHGVGLHSPVFIGEQFAGPTQTRLDLVEDEQQLVFVTKFPESRQKII